MLVAPALILGVSLTLGPAQRLRLDGDAAVSPSILDMGLHVALLDAGPHDGAGGNAIAQP